MNQTSKSLFDRIGGRETLAVLLRHFYADVRQHQLIGPIFNQHIHDWPAHLAKVSEFWARLTGGPSDFVGSLPFKHAGLGLDARHFDVWLGLWEANCQSYVAPPEAGEMVQLARMIGRRLQSILVNKEVSERLQLTAVTRVPRHLV